MRERFPGISAFLAQHGLDLARDLIPVRPAAHYLMGGIRTDLAGRTSLSGLYAAGEVACTGVHGANRLASNSLSKGWSSARGRRSPCSTMGCAGACRCAGERPGSANGRGRSSFGRDDCRPASGDVGPRRFAAAGVLAAGRDQGARGLRGGFGEFGRAAERKPPPSRSAGMSRVAHAILASALARTESRGAAFPQLTFRAATTSVPEALGPERRWVCELRGLVDLPWNRKHQA